MHADSTINYFCSKFKSIVCMIKTYQIQKSYGRNNMSQQTITTHDIVDTAIAAGSFNTLAAALTLPTW